MEFLHGRLFFFSCATFFQSEAQPRNPKIPQPLKTPRSHIRADGSAATGCRAAAHRESGDRVRKAGPLECF